MIGIVCEYNPFHNGHAYHITRSLQEIGPDEGVVCVMSGDFVQRGEPAVYSKFARAEAACRGGADLVLELPLPWCLSSAEGFARGAVGLLGAFGVRHLAFGSETGEAEELEELAGALLQPGVQEEITALLKNTPALSYAAARQMVMERQLGEKGKRLTQPNNILGVEYIRAIYDLRLDMEPFAIRREGSEHDGEGRPGLRSASEIRKTLLSGRSIRGEVPPEAMAVYERERRLGREIRDRGVFETALLSRLRLYEEDYYQCLPDAADGLGNRLFQAVRREAGYDAILAAARSKRFPLSRIRRLCLCACLGITAGMNEGTPPYARVLAANERGRELLRERDGKGSVPILTKPAAVRQLSGEAARLFTLGASAHDFYVLGYTGKEERRPGGDWRSGPFVLRSGEKEN